MEANRDISYEEYIPTDRFAIQDMYLHRVHLMGLRYQDIMRQWYRGGTDLRSITEFMALADEFFQFARGNMEKHILKGEIEFLEKTFDDTTRLDLDVEEVKKLFRIFQKFAAKSKLTELSEKKFMWSFAYARKKLGIQGKGGGDDEGR